MASDTPDNDTLRHERRATWMELFFDLVAVAGIGQLTHVLHHGPTIGEFALYALLYLAFWIGWASVTLYGDIAYDHIRLPLMLAAMLGLGVMAAAVPGMPDRHATAFAAVYVVVRIGLSQVWGRGRIVVDWPNAQLTGGVLPWIVSLWVPEPWKFWLWALGLAIDLWGMFAVSGERMMAGAQEAFDRRLRRSHRFEGVEIPKLQALHVDPEHLGERLGLYVIIVLGEGVIGIIAAIGGVAWNARVLSLGFGAFVILTGLWALTLTYGFIPRLMSGDTAPDAVPRQHLLAAHCLLTGAIATIAAGLSLVLSHPDGHLGAGVGWALCGGAAAYFLLTALGGARSRDGWRWTLTWPLPGALVAVVLGAFGPRLDPLWLVYGIVLTIGWALGWEYRRTRS
ncbi:low temperature requirement protein A [Nocardia sp. NPDC004068]|uniref:low temperature requirement protein A n=1 Tax=Nocardia sp. NPDC004068 TaxID=3364303 RepID=UPI003699107C